MFYSRWPARTVCGDSVVGTIVSAPGRHGANRNYSGLVTRARDAAIDRLTGGIFTVVTGRCHNDDTVLHSKTGRGCKRIGCCRLVGPMSQREVDHANVHAPAIITRRVLVLDCPFDSRDHVAGVTSTVSIQDSQIDQLRSSGYTLKPTKGSTARSCNNTGHVCSMTVSIDAACFARIDEVHRLYHVLQVGMRRDTTIDHCDADAGSCNSVGLRGQRSTGRHSGFAGKALDWLVERNVFDVLVVGQLLHLIRGHFNYTDLQFAVLMCSFSAFFGYVSLIVGGRWRDALNDDADLFFLVAIRLIPMDPVIKMVVQFWMVSLPGPVPLIVVLVTVCVLTPTVILAPVLPKNRAGE